MRKINKHFKNIFIGSNSFLSKPDILNYKNRYVSINYKNIIFKKVYMFLLCLNKYNHYELPFFDFSNKKYIYVRVHNFKCNSSTVYFVKKKI